MREELRNLDQMKSVGKALGVFEFTGRALIVVDYTKDFIADDGKLTCGKPGQDIEDELVRVTEEATENGDFVVYAIDLHKEGDEFHPESKLFPPHNIEGTEGRQLYGRLNEVYMRTFKNSNVYYMDKTRYSAFAGTNLESKLRERGITTVDIIGVCTDICVLHTAVDAYNKGFNVRVHSKAVASFDPVGHEYALRHMKNVIGAEIL